MPNLFRCVGGKNVKLLGTGYSFNISGIYPNYANITAANFIIGIVSTQTYSPAGSGAATVGTVTPTLSYNATTGVVTVSNYSKTVSQSGGVTYQLSCSVKIYLVY